MSGGTLHIRQLGFVPYEQAWRLQRDLQRELLDGGGADTLLLCEHEPVITLGRSAKREHILADDAELRARGVPVYDVERGGDVTWHGPGQVTAYPIIDLNKQRRDVHWYVHGLEEVVIRVLRSFGLQGTRCPGRSGVWMPAAPGGAPRRKICSLGVRISRWRTLHGLALNIRRCCGEGFALIQPCGLRDVQMTSLEEELALCGSLQTWDSRAPRHDLSVRRSAALLAEQFTMVFEYEGVMHA